MGKLFRAELHDPKQALVKVDERGGHVQLPRPSTRSFNLDVVVEWAVGQLKAAGSGASCTIWVTEERVLDVLRIPEGSKEIVAQFCIVKLPEPKKEG